MKYVIALTALLTMSTATAGYEDSVKELLRDPESAQFKNVGTYSGGGAQVYCGYVNSKNGFGGYSGWKEFISNGVDITIIKDMKELSDGAFEETWNRFCRN